MKLFSCVYKSIFPFILIAILSVSEGYSQTYFTSAGVRLGNTWGLTVNQRILKRVTFEGILQNDFKNTTYLHLMLRKHQPVITRRMNFYMGGGIHTGMQNETGGIAGVNGVVGLEFTLLRLNISADLMPQYTSGGNGVSLKSGVSVRYVLVKDKAIKRWNKKRQKRRKKRQRQNRRRR